MYFVLSFFTFYLFTFLPSTSASASASTSTSTFSTTFTTTTTTCLTSQNSISATRFSRSYIGNSGCCNNSAMKWQCSHPWTGLRFTAGGIPCDNNYSGALTNTQHSQTSCLPCQSACSKSYSQCPIQFHLQSQPNQHGSLGSFCGFFLCRLCSFPSTDALTFGTISSVSPSVTSDNFSHPCCSHFFLSLVAYSLSSLCTIRPCTSRFIETVPLLLLVLFTCFFVFIRFLI